MIVSGHQPVYLPWLGYFHKLSLCDAFVYMDTVQYLENDWNNRNKIRTSQGALWLTAPIDRRKTKGKMLHEIVLCNEQAEHKDFWQKKHWQSIENNYAKARFFADYAEELKAFYLENHWLTLNDLCWAQFKMFSKWLGLQDKKVVRMTEVQFEGKKDALVLDHCVKLGADAVVFGINGRSYVDLAIFRERKIKVYFQNYQHPTYTQRFHGFESHMSVLDLLCNHGADSYDILMSGNVTKGMLLENELWEV